MRRAVASVVAACTVLTSACTGGEPHATVTASPGPAPSATGAPFTPQPFQPALWPIATRADLAAYRRDPATIPWAADRVAVAEHFARDVLRMSDVHGVAHCVRACTNVDLYVAGRHVGGIWLTAEKDIQPTVYSAGGAYSPDVETSVELGSFSDPAVAFGRVTRPVGPLQVSLQTLTGSVLATTTTAPTRADRDWTAVLTPLATSWHRGVLVLTTRKGGAVTRLTAVGVQQQVPPAPAARVRCGRTELAIVQPGQFHVGYTGDASFGFYVANVGSRVCVLDGYADLTFTYGTTVLPFTIRHGSGMGYRDPGPHPVTIRPGSAAVFAVDKYRCDEGGDEMSDVVRIQLPGLRGVSLETQIVHCKGGLAGDILTVTALAGSRAELSR